MVLIKSLAPYWYWLMTGLSSISIPIGAFNLGLLIILTLSNKGIYVPIWGSVIVCMSVILFGLLVGHTLDKRGMNAEINRRINETMNPQFKDQCKKIDAIIKYFGIEVKDDIQD